MMNGGNILVLQRVLGHASLQMTMRYAHLAPDHLQEVLKLNPLAKKPRTDSNFMANVEKLPVQERVGISSEASPKGKKKAPGA